MVRCVFACLVLLTIGSEAAVAQRLAFDPPTAREGAILRALSQEVQLRFDDVRLDKFCDFIYRNYGFLPRVDHKALDEIGIGEETPLSGTVDRVPLHTALDVILQDTDPALTWGIEREMLVITTRDAAEEREQTWIYDVTALVDSYGEYGRDFDSLIELITRSIDPDSWDEVGGPGQIAEYETNGKAALVIRQTYAVHRKIDRFLRQLYRLAGRPVPSSSSGADGLSRGRWVDGRWQGDGQIDNPRNLPMTKPRRSAETSAARVPRRFYSSADRPVAVIYADAK